MSKRYKSSAELSKHILNTAHKLVDQFGIQNVSMHQIAVSADIGQGTLYRRFANKGDLCMELMKDDLEVLIKEVDQQIHFPAKRFDVREKLEKFLYLWISFLDKEYELIEIMRAENNPDASRAQFYSNPLFNYIYEQLTIMLDEVRKHYQLKVDTQFIVVTIVKSINSGLYSNFKIDCSYSLDEIYENFKKMYLDPLFYEKNKT